MLQRTISGEDLDIQGDLYGHIVLSGEGTTLKNFPERLARELQALTKFEVKVVCCEDRNISTWQGGSILT